MKQTIFPFAPSNHGSTSGDGEIRTHDPLLAGQVLSQLSYIPILIWQPPTLPCRLQQSTIGRPGLNHRVRDGNGCVPRTHRHQKFFVTLFARSPLAPFITKQWNNLYYADSAACLRLPPTFPRFSLRKEVIQPHLPIRLPCYDFTPVTGSTFGSSSLSVRSLTSGISDSHGVTGGVYKTRERIHRDILIRDY